MFLFFYQQYNPAGFINMLIMCSNKDHSPDDKVVVRVFGDHKYLSEMFHRDSEFAVLEAVSHNGLIPPVLAR